MNGRPSFPSIAHRTAVCSHSLRSRSREVDGWFLIIGSLVRGYIG